jgi:hypothetical protein
MDDDDDDDDDKMHLKETWSSGVDYNRLAHVWGQCRSLAYTLMKLRVAKWTEDNAFTE